MTTIAQIRQLLENDVMPKGDPRQSSDLVEGGRRAGEQPNPYLSARRTWNDLMRASTASRRSWEMLALLCLLIVLASVGGMIYIGSQSKFIPYRYDVDHHGRAVAVGPMDAASPTDPRVLAAAVSGFIEQARRVSADIALQRKAVFAVYAMLNQQDQAFVKMNQWLNGSDDVNPFKRAETETVSVDITSVLQQTADTWEVSWQETVWDRKGDVKATPVPMRALVTVYVVEPTADTSEEQVRQNPIGLFVRDFSWSKQL